MSKFDRVIFVPTAEEVRQKVVSLQHTAVSEILALKPRKVGTIPPTVLNRPAAKLGMICRRFCIASGALKSTPDQLHQQWKEIEEMAQTEGAARGR